MADAENALSASMSRRALLSGVAMMATAVAASAMRPRPVIGGVAAPRLGALVPNQIGPWRFISQEGLVVARAEDDDAAADDGYAQLLTRVYAAPGRPTIMLLLAYGAAQGGGLQLHRPETCYPGQGFALRDFRDADLHFAGVPSKVRARQFTAVRDERNERLIYWTRIGTEFPKSTLEEYLAILSGAIDGGVSDGILVRFSTIDSDTAEADAALGEFTHALVDATSPAGKRVLIGVPGKA